MTTSKQMILCDTGIISRYTLGIDEILEEIDSIQLKNIAINPVIFIELNNWLSGYSYLTKSQRALITRTVKAIPILHITEPISRLAVSLAENNINSKPGDTLIAATALHHGLKIYTLNKRDFISLGAELH